VVTRATYRLHDHSGYDLGLLEHPPSNLEPSDVAVLADGRKALVKRSRGGGVGTARRAA